MSDEILTPKIEPQGSVLDKYEADAFGPDALKVSSTGNEIQLMKMGQFFDVPSPSSREEMMMQYIYGFFDKAGVQDMNQLMFELSSVQRKLGNSPYGVSNLNQVYNYLKTLSMMGDFPHATEIKNLMET